MRKRSVEKARELKDIKDREKERFTSYLRRGHVSLMRELSKETGLPISALLSQAVEDFLENVEYIQGEPLMPRVDIKAYLKRDRATGRK